MKKNIKLYYVGTRGINFGDSINPILFERLFGIDVKRGYPTNSDVVGIGSIMQMFTLRHIIKNKKYLYFLKYNLNPIITMGTGFSYDISKFNFGVSTYRNIHPLILRGKLSHNVLEKINKKGYSGVIYGDLGLLFSHLLEKKVTKRYSLGIIPHKFDYNNPKVGCLLNSILQSTLIDLRMPPLETLKKISECDAVISSSLHGLVAADSLGIPNVRMKLSNHGFDFNVDFKFDDYYSIFSDSKIKYIDFMADDEHDCIENLTPQKIYENYDISFEDIKRNQDLLFKTGQKLKDIL